MGAGRRKLGKLVDGKGDSTDGDERPAYGHILENLTHKLHPALVGHSLQNVKLPELKQCTYLAANPI